jgi:hypothetical protein
MANTQTYTRSSPSARPRKERPEFAHADPSKYEGKAGPQISVREIDDVVVSDVGIETVDNQSNVVEHGKTTRDSVDKTLWVYVATKNANVSQVKMALDGIDLP